MGKFTEEELQQYIHKYKLEAQNSANEDMDKLFERSNTLVQKLNSDLIVFASVMLTIMGGIIAANEIVLSLHVKATLITGILALLASIMAGLIGYHSMSRFWLIWAKAKQERGKLIENDESKSYDDLVALRTKLTEHESKLPQTSSKVPGWIQVTCFIIGLLLVTLSIIGALFDLSFLSRLP